MKYGKIFCARYGVAPVHCVSFNFMDGKMALQKDLQEMDIGHNIIANVDKCVMQWQNKVVGAFSALSLSLSTAPLQLTLCI